VVGGWKGVPINQGKWVCQRRAQARRRVGWSITLGAGLGIESGDAVREHLNSAPDWTPVNKKEKGVDSVLLRRDDSGRFKSRTQGEKLTRTTLFGPRLQDDQRADSQGQTRVEEVREGGKKKKERGGLGLKSMAQHQARPRSIEVWGRGRDGRGEGVKNDNDQD